MTQSTQSITLPLGFTAASGTCGIKPSGKPDLALIVSDRPASLAALFTTNKVAGAPVIVGRQHAKAGKGRAFVCNSGVSNVATGAQGIADALNMCAAVGHALQCDPRHVLPMSTGIIGHRLPIDKILTGIDALAPQLARGPATDAATAQAILTTDLVPKAASRSIKLGKSTVHLGGIAKGSGMISPNMATMLVFLSTDARISPALLRKSLREAVNADGSFNRITVDSDTSTSDTIAILANGAAGNAPINKPDAAYKKFSAALSSLCVELAYKVISDGEGATHVIHATVRRAATADQAHRAARAIADSPLVKTAVHGRDPNWGRIAMAVGKCGIRLDMDRLSISIAGFKVMQRGKPVTFDKKKASLAMKSFDVVIDVDLGLGQGRCTVLGCDLSREYIAINADYTT